MAIFSHVPNREHENLRRNESALLHQKTKDVFKIRAYILHFLIKAMKRIRVSAHCMKREKALVLTLHGFIN
jgi:hypothetical protein